MKIYEGMVVEFNPGEFSTHDLLRCYAAILDELRSRGVIRTQNNPVADYAEWLTAKKLGLELTPNSNAGYDAIGSNGDRFQIKSRRIDLLRDRRQLSVIRNLDAIEFDYLIGVLFSMDFSTVEAYKVPHAIIRDFARFSSHQNGYILHLCGNILNSPGVEDISRVLADERP
jgi:hypothetical protein